jgi:flagellar biosynthesis protein FlhG
MFQRAVNSRSGASVLLSKPAETICIISGEAGVGRTTLAANLVAYRLRRGATVRLRDGRIDESGTLVSAVAGAEVVVDCAAGAADSTLAWAERADRLVLVARPEPESIADAYGLLKVLSRRGVCAPAGLVLNRVVDAAEADRAAERLRRTAAEFLGRGLDDLGRVPHDPHVLRAARRGRTLLIDSPRSRASLSLAVVFQRLSPRARETATSSAVWLRLGSLFL